MPKTKANILVVFYSRDGSVEALAKAIGEGAKDAGADVRLRRVPDLVSPDVMAKVPGWEERSKRMLAEYGAPTHADVEWADGIGIGSIEHVPPFPPHLHQPNVVQHPQMLRHGWLLKAQRSDDLAHGLLLLRQMNQNQPPSRLGHCVECI